MKPNRLFRDGSRAPAPALMLLAVGLSLWTVAPTLAVESTDPALASPLPSPVDPGVAPPPVEWLNFREAKTVARHSERPLMVYFTTARSRPGARLDRETWTDVSLRRYLDQHLVTARVDVQDMPAVAGLFDIGEVPTLLFLAPDGQRLVVLRGFNSPEAVQRVATYVATRAYEFAEYDIWKARHPDR